MSMKLTDWYPMNVWPMRSGIYELSSRLNNDQWFALFKGHQWYVARKEIRKAASERQLSMSAYNGIFIGWRGLAEDPNGGAA